MVLRTRFLMLVGAAHVVIVLLGACHRLPARSGGLPAQAVLWYARVSGADSDYGFFAPEVGSEQRARFLLQDDQGAIWSDAIDRAASPEARLRLGTIVDYPFMSGTAAALPAWRQELVKSWAAAMFTRHPRAVALTVVVEAYDVPTMAEYRAGRRPEWKVVYQAQVRRERPAEPGEAES